MAKTRKRGAATPEMNMTPLIDVTFQLIIFFMLVNNIIAEQAVEMKVPELTQPQTREVEEGNRLVVNVAPDLRAEVDRQEESRDPLNVPGQAARVVIGQDEFAPGDLAAIEASLKEAKARRPEIQVLLRADAALHYQEVATVMQAISAAQITRVEIVALLPEATGAPVALQE